VGEKKYSAFMVDLPGAPATIDPPSEKSKTALNTLLKPINGKIDKVLETGTKSLIEKIASSFEFRDRDADVSDSVRFINAFATLLVNIPDLKPADTTKTADATKPALFTYSKLIEKIAEVTESVKEKVKQHLDAILHNSDPGGDFELRKLEANWRGLADIVESVTSDDVIIDFLDLTKEELHNDMIDNAADPFGSALFEKIYVDEYDRYGGRPFATMIGLYEYGSSADDVKFFRALMRVCAAAHCPYVSAVDAKFFGDDRKSMAAVASVTDLDAIMNAPRMAKWKALRDEEWAAYIGLTLPRYLVRLPWDADDDENDQNKTDNRIGYREEVTPEGATDDNGFLWGNAAVLFARNVVRSYERSGWAQHIRGPLGGGVVEGLTAYTYKRPDGSKVLLNPVEIAIPDYREYQFSRSGLIPLVQKKGEALATFFSAQSIKLPRDFQEDTNTRNAYLVTNLAYTYSITAIAHYVKATMREYIGSTADGPYIQQVLANWLSRFVTTVVNPDDLTLLYYPFKAASVEVEPKPGAFGWYKATISVLPHVQFEGMDVELRLEAALGGKA
jgi:type VI secretion system protein ImpC